MKKTSIITINLKSARLFILLCLFLWLIYTGTFLINKLPPIKLAEDPVRLLLSCNVAYNEHPLPTVSAFSLAKKEIIKTPQEDFLPADSSPTLQTASTPQVKNPQARVEVNNSTSHKISPDDYLSSAPSFLNEDFAILIVHTHTTESYTPSEKYNYTPMDTDRTTDKNYNMVAVGDAIEKILTSHGIKVYHDTTINDYPSYSGSYNKSATAIENFIKNDPSIKIVLDVHRDAILGTNGEKVKYTADIDGKTAAKIMFVTGSNLSGLKHDNWTENMRFAVHLQKHTLSLYPDLCRPINFRNQRFNQQLAPGGVIVEVGTNANTLDEAIYGAQCFATALADFIKRQ